ncbi:MAG TPA: hypothetical protein VJ302_28035 [Blastocatellia bacterium]|nr:hypothetical protein [Blastocatellia bacterium]
MSKIEAVARYLVVLRPGTIKVDFIPTGIRPPLDATMLETWYGAMNRAFEEVDREIRQSSTEAVQSLSDATSLFRRCRELVDLAGRMANPLKFEEPFLRRVAVLWLEENPLPLGEAPLLSESETNRWRTTRSERAQLRTQDAIDWRAKYWRSLAKARESGDRERYDGCEELGISGSGRATILKVRQSAQRPNLVDLSNLKAFVAEHLLAYPRVAQYLDIPNRFENAVEPSMTFFFQALRGLGQCRAVVNWEAVDGGGLTSALTEAQLVLQTSQMQLDAMDSLFNQSLIQSFSLAFRQSLSDLLENGSSALSKLRRSLADLWWAQEVRFSIANKLSHRLVRAEDEELDDWQEAPPAGTGNWEVQWQGYERNYPGFFATSGTSHPNVTYLRLSLSGLIEAQRHRGLPESRVETVTHFDLQATLASLLFDEVQFACHFFDIDPEDLAEWVDRLGAVIYDELAQHTVQRLRVDRQRNAGLESAAHWVNSLIRNTDRAGAARKMKRILDQMEPKDPHHEELKAIQRSLDLLLLVEGGASLMRLLGVLGHSEYTKLTSWFTNSSIQEWEEPMAFQKYQQSITHLARAIGSVHGYPSVTVVTDGEEIHYHEYCHLDFDELRFPPLSKRAGREPILALLPALTEPLSNAFNYLETVSSLMPPDVKRERPPAIRLEIQDCRKSALPHILVKIGNRYFSNDLISPTGIAKAREFMKFAKVATIGEPQVESRGDGNYFWVPVFLHPQQLHQLIQATLRSNS